MENEKESAMKAKKMMEESKLFSEEEIKGVEDMIMSTRVSFDSEGMKQSFVDNNNYLTLIIADADVANLGIDSDYYWVCTEDLMREVFKINYPSRDQMISFLNGSLKLLKNHNYFTIEAQDRYQNQQTNFEYTKRKLAELINQALV